MIIKIKRVCKGYERGRRRGKGNNYRSNKGRYDKLNIECYNCYKIWLFFLRVIIKIKLW